MDFSLDLTYDAPPEAVHAMLTDPAFRERVCDAFGATRRQVEVSGAAPGLTVVLDQTQPAEGIPPIATKFVGEEIRLVQTETWSDATRAVVDLVIPGKPARFDGSLVLTPSGSGTTETVAGVVAVKVPLVGGKIEAMVADLLRTALKAESRVGRAWLAERV